MKRPPERATRLLIGSFGLGRFSSSCAPLNTRSEEIGPIMRNWYDGSTQPNHLSLVSSHFTHSHNKLSETRWPRALRSHNLIKLLVSWFPAAFVVSAVILFPIEHLEGGFLLRNTPLRASLQRGWKDCSFERAQPLPQKSWASFPLYHVAVTGAGARLRLQPVPWRTATRSMDEGIEPTRL